MRFYTTEKLGEKQSLTPEGFLLCQDVPIARTGIMVYGPGETTIEAGPDGLVYIDRIAPQVFRAETIASFEGKPVVNEHPNQPDEDRWTVDPKNWREVAIGVVLSPRQGTGVDNEELLLADLLITDEEAIRIVRQGKRELSCGYLADYVQTSIGHGQQVNILGNHVALVDAGRCGSRCAIGDHALKETKVMSKIQQWKDRIAKAWADKDEKEMKKALEESPEEKAEDGRRMSDSDINSRFEGVEKSVKDGFEKMNGRLDGMDKRVKDESEEKEKKEKESKEAADKKEVEDKEIEGELEEEAPAGTGDKAKKAHDSAYLEESFEETVALAEIMAPGIQIPTFDRAKDPKRTVTDMCRLRRQVLDLAYTKPEIRGFLDAQLAGKEIKTLTCDSIRSVYRAVGAFKKHANNQSHFREEVSAGGGTGVAGPIKTPADFNARAADFWSKHS